MKDGVCGPLIYSPPLCSSSELIVCCHPIVCCLKALLITY